ncbi:MAG: hypothetical protein WCW93_03750 [Candidatus Paceibacterota bacterium]
MLYKRHILSMLCSLSLVASFSLSAGNDSWSQSGSNFSYTRTSKINKSELQNGGIRYTFSVSPPGVYSFDTGYGTCSPGTISVTSGTATGIAEYDNNSLPSADVSMAMSGKLIASGPGGGTQPTWDANATLKAPFNIRSNYDNGAKVITVPAGTNVTYSAYEGSSSKNSNWTVNGNTKNNESSIIFSRSWWDVSGWFSEGMGTPDPGVYNITASPTDDANISDSGIMTIVGAQFSQGTCSGYDDYTNWNKGASDYYSPNRTGYCTKPFFSLKDEANGTALLTLTPSPVSESVNITENDSSIENLSPANTTSSTNVSFKGIAGFWSDEGDIDAVFKNTTLASITVCAYKEKNIDVLIVKVNGASHAADYGRFSQAIVTANIDDLTYNKSTITVDGIEYNINDNTIWSEAMFRQLRDDFYTYNSTAAYDYVQFIVKGSMDDGSCGMSDNIPAKDSWVLRDIAASRTYPHELGHCLGLYHRNSDKDALMCQTADANIGVEKLRKAEWDDVN